MATGKPTRWWIHAIWIMVLGYCAYKAIGSAHEDYTQHEYAKAHALRANYGTALCDDAFKTQTDHADETTDLKFFDVDLKDGCFSGIVMLPRKWGTWGMQLIGDQETSWVAYWWKAAERPNGPFSYQEFNFRDVQSFGYGNMMTRDPRVQGKGKLRFFLR